MSLSLVGQVLGGRYRVDELVGQGGMSAVYKAYDPNLKRVVAIKTIHSHLAADPRFLVRFEEEATAVAQLRHPNIVQVFDYNHDGDLYYMVQEFLVGETLHERLRRLNKAGERMPLSGVIAVALNTSDAAGYAHRRGMIHRDIKPANIMLDLHDQAILMDFGIVKLTGAEQHTATGAVLGTALYMPPEVIQGETPDARSDLYSLGVTLYEMVSGRPPFKADSTMGLMMMHLHDAPPDLRALRPGVPEALVAVIEKALAKSRDDRYGSMADLAAALKEALERVEAAAVPGAAVLGEPKAAMAHERRPTPPPPGGGRAASPGQKVLPVGGGPFSTRGAPDAGVVPARLVLEPAGGAAIEPERAEWAGPGRAAAGAGGAPPGGASQAASRKRGAAGAAPGARPKVSLVSWIVGAVVVLALTLGGLFALLLSPGQDRAGPTLPSVSAQGPDSGQEATPTTPAAAIVAGSLLARISGITLDSQQRYVVEYETSGLTEQPSGAHLHFFFNSVPPELAGAPAKGLWTDYTGSPPFAQVKQSDRPENASQLCVLVANPDHSVQVNSGTCSVLPDVVTAVALQDTACLAGPAADFPPAAQLKAGQAVLVRGLSPDEGWWSVANPQELDESCWLSVPVTQVSGNISSLPLVEGPPLPSGATPDGLSVEILHIGMDDQGRYVVEFETVGFTAQLPGTHIHFFFDTVPPEQVGISAGGLRLMYGGLSPFTGYARTDRPAEAGQMCALVANPDHSVLPGSGNCMMLPDAP